MKKLGLYILSCLALQQVAMCELLDVYRYNIVAAGYYGRCCFAHLAHHNRVVGNKITAGTVAMIFALIGVGNYLDWQSKQETRWIVEEMLREAVTIANAALNESNLMALGRRLKGG